jgi:hypothetical protein
MCCIMGESQGMFSGRTWRWVTNPDPHPHSHPISILVPCDLHGAPQWHGSGPTTLSVMAHVYRGMHVLHDASQWHVQLPHMALGVPACTGPTTCMLFSQWYGRSTSTSTLGHPYHRASAEYTMGAQVQALAAVSPQPLSVSVSVSGSWLKRVVSG